jgi:hypothetical protein
MSGERDLARLLAALRVSARDGEFVFVGSATGDAALAAIAKQHPRGRGLSRTCCREAQADAAHLVTTSLRLADAGRALGAGRGRIDRRRVGRGWPIAEFPATCWPACIMIICWSRPTAASTPWRHWNAGGCIPT